MTMVRMSSGRSTASSSAAPSAGRPRAARIVSIITGRPRGSGRADARQERQHDDHRLAGERQLEALGAGVVLGQEDDANALVERRPVHVDRRAERQRERRDLARTRPRFSTVSIEIGRVMLDELVEKVVIRAGAIALNQRISDSLPTNLRSSGNVTPACSTKASATVTM